MLPQLLASAQVAIIDLYAHGTVDEVLGLEVALEACAVLENRRAIRD